MPDVPHTKYRHVAAGDNCLVMISSNIRNGSRYTYCKHPRSSPPTGQKPGSIQTVMGCKVPVGSAALGLNKDGPEAHRTAPLIHAFIFALGIDGSM